MDDTGRSWSLSAILLALSGVTLIGAGLYFLLLRPPLLPEDLRYMGLEPAHVAAVRPRMEPWLAHVFRVMGGYVLATGVLAITLAATSFRLHQRGAGLGALIVLLALDWWGGVAALVAAAVAAILMSNVARRQVGGYTGDVLGAIEQGGEVTVMLAAAAWAS